MPRARAILPTAAAGLTNPPLVGNPGDGNELHAFVEHPLERAHVDLAAVIAWHDIDNCTRSLRHLKIGNVIGGVFRLGGQDAIAGAKWERIECHLPGDRCILGERDLVRRGIHQAGNRAVDEPRSRSDSRWAAA